MSTDERADIPNNRRNCTISVPKSVAKVNVSALPTSEVMPTHVETPPMPIAYEDEAARKILAGAPDGPEGRWQNLYLKTYLAGGRIFYRERDALLLDAVFVFGK